MSTRIFCFLLTLLMRISARPLYLNAHLSWIGHDSFFRSSQQKPIHTESVFDYLSCAPLQRKKNVIQGTTRCLFKSTGSWDGSIMHWQKLKHFRKKSFAFAAKDAGGWNSCWQHFLENAVQCFGPGGFFDN